jgi:hypothetical protein
MTESGAANDFQQRLSESNLALFRAFASKVDRVSFA